jgi:hypothetical protein
MDEYEDNSLSCSSDKKRGWDLFNDHLDYNQSAAENKRICTEWPPSLEAKPNLDFSFSPFSSPEWLDRQAYSPRAANIGLCNELGFSDPSTTHWCNHPEEIGRIDPPASCLTDLSWSASNTIPSEVVFDQNSGNAVATVYPAPSAYSINQEQLGIPSSPFVGAYWPRYEVQIATQQTLAQHYQNEISFSSTTLTYSSIGIQDFPRIHFQLQELPRSHPLGFHKVAPARHCQLNRLSSRTKPYFTSYPEMGQIIKSILLNPAAVILLPIRRAFLNNAWAHKMQTGLGLLTWHWVTRKSRTLWTT